jgi:DNA helicase HerA-like ATPase
MEDLLKRARSAGVGVFLATQSPGDFDYKCKENVRTWLIGRVKEPRAIEKLKPMLAAAKGDVTDKLAGRATGEFYPRPRVERVGGALGPVVAAHRADAGEPDRAARPRIGFSRSMRLGCTSRTRLSTSTAGA